MLREWLEWKKTLPIVEVPLATAHFVHPDAECPIQSCNLGPTIVGSPRILKGGGFKS